LIGSEILKVEAIDLSRSANCSTKASQQSNEQQFEFATHLILISESGRPGASCRYEKTQTRIIKGSHAFKGVKKPIGHVRNAKLGIPIRWED